MFQRGRHNSGRLLAIRSAANDQSLSRFGYAISKRVGKAVTRNKIRRRLREALRALPLKEGYDLVITARTDAALASYQDLATELQTLLTRGRLLESPE